VAVAVAVATTSRVVLVVVTIEVAETFVVLISLVVLVILVGTFLDFGFGFGMGIGAEAPTISVVVFNIVFVGGTDGTMRVVVCLSLVEEFEVEVVTGTAIEAGAVSSDAVFLDEGVSNVVDGVEGIL
tara:strand:- start:296 stop:676 length:381 start_codon:yes stop_codon:yes gene_type:complete